MNEQLKVIISAEIQNLKKNIDSAKKEIGGFKDKVNAAKKNVDSDIAKIGKGMTVAAAAIGAAAIAAGKSIYNLASSTAEYGDTVEKNSQKVGLSYSAYQKWDYAMQIAGTSMADCTNGLKTLTNTFDDAQKGSSTAQEKFNRLGLSLDDLKGKSREEVFEKTVEALQNVSDETEKAALANDLFGKSGQNLLPLFNQSTKATKELLAEAERYGMVMSDDAVDASADFEDSLTRLKKSFGGIKNTIGAELVPVLTDLMGKIQDKMPQIKETITNVFEAVKAGINFITEHQGLFTAIGVAIGVISAAIAAYNVVRAVKLAMDAAEVTSLTGLIAVHAAHAVAVMASLAPYIAIAAAIAAVIAVIVLCIKHWDKIKEATKKAFEAVKKTVSTAVDKVVGFFKKIFDWIKTNWAGIGLLLVNPLAGAFKLAYDNCDGFRTKVNTFVSNVKTAVSNGFNAVKNFITKPISAAKEAAVKVFENLKSGIKSKIDAARDAVKSAIDKIKSFFNFKWSLPKLKMPHFSVSGKFSLNPPSIPKFNISWYKQGGVFNKPTLFPYGNGQVGGLGEDGAEAVVPLEKNTVWLDKIAERLSAKNGSTPIVLQVDGKTFAETTVRSLNDLTRLRGTLPLKIM